MRARGFSLLELLVFIVIVSIVLLGLVGLFATNVRGSADVLLRQQAIEVARAYMETVKNRKWNHNTPAGGGCVNTGSGYCPTGPAAAPIGNDGQARADYDDVDDYNGIDEAPMTLDAGGNLVPVAGLGGYRVQVAVSQPGSALSGVAAADQRLITVTVTAPDGQRIVLNAIRVNY
ncbi:MAG: type II secretion system protein [Gammaproteobacteria bacterium]|nr:MAG: type II secretion system protein [Gammaproteobacteria bacterium]